MAAPSYTTDLADVTLASATTTNPGTWAELSGHTGGGAATADTDFFVQGTNCISQSMGTGTGTNAGLQYTHTSNIGTGWVTGNVVLVWNVFLPVNAVATWANGGLRIGIGSSAGNIKFWNALGNDSGRAPYGGWQNTAIDPTFAADATEGTPVAGNYTVFGSSPNLLSAVTKGNPHGVDAIRYGRGKLIITGGDLANGYGTFAGLASTNDSINNRWGLFQLQAGSYLWKGLISLGSDAVAVDFRDSNRNIVIDDTPRTYASFNRIEIRNAGSRVDWTAISFSPLGTLAKGEFEAVANADINIDSCTFTDMSTFIFQSNSTVLDSTFRRTGLVTLGGATFNGVTFDKSAATIALACTGSVSGLSNCTFISDGTGHAIQITSGTSHTLNNITFTGYAASNGSTGNESVFVNIASGSVTIYADSTFSYRTSGATVTIVAGSVTAALTVTDNTGVPISNASVMVQAAAGGNLPSNVNVSISNSSMTATVNHSNHGMITNDKVLIKGGDIPANRGVHTITVLNINQYTYTLETAPGFNPTGIITATWVALSGTTDANGQISMSRVFSANQPIIGWSRKSSASPYYKTGPISGVINSSTGGSFTALLIKDE